MRQRPYLVALAVISFAGPLSAAGPPDLQLVPRGAWMFAHVRGAELWNSPTAREFRDRLQKSSPNVIADLEKNVGVPVEAVDSVTVIWPTTEVRNIGESIVVVVNLNRPMDRKAVLAALSRGEADREGLPDGFYRLKSTQNGTLYLAGDRRLVVFETERARRDLFDLLLRRDGPGLDDALAAAAKGHTAVLGVRPAVIKALEEIEPGRDQEREVLLPLLSADTVTAVADLGGKLRFDVTARYPGKGGSAKAEQSAKALLSLARIGLAAELARLPKDREADRKLLEAVAAGLNAAKLERTEETLRVSGEVEAAPLFAAMAEALSTVPGAAARTQSQNNLKQIALAMHNYESTYGTMPPAAICDRQGKALLSWRVAILPFLDQVELYEQFRLDEPWDSEHNKKLLAKMPRTYAHPAGEPLESAKTHYRVFVGGGAAFDMRKGVRLADFQDGTSNTILAAEAAEAVPWTRPDDLTYDPRKALPKMATLCGDGFLAALGDGSVQFFKKSIKEKTMRALITRSGGEVIDFNDP